MMRDGRRLLGRMTFGLGLVLAAQLAYAAQIVCVSPSGMLVPQSAAAQERCSMTSVAPDVCLAGPQGARTLAAAAAPSSPDPQPAAGAPFFARGTSFAAAGPRQSSGLAPGSPLPLYILLRRYLS